MAIYQTDGAIQYRVDGGVVQEIGGDRVLKEGKLVGYYSDENIDRIRRALGRVVEDEARDLPIFLRSVRALIPSNGINTPGRLIYQLSNGKLATSLEIKAVEP